MRTLRLTIAYDGARYAGWQVQKDSHRPSAISHQRRLLRPTIQGTLEQVLQQILQEQVNVVGSSRTDAGVHAIAQVAHVRTHSRMPCERLLRSVNQLLPDDIAVTQLEEASSMFHARFHAVSKQYRYRIFTGPVIPPFIRPYVYHVRTPLNVTLMRRELAAMRGRHDFQAFARRRPGNRNTVRRITRVDVRRRGDELHVDIQGEGFLHTMVRSIVGTLIDIGRGHLPPGTVRRLLRSGKRQFAGVTAPAQGLTLLAVAYQSTHRQSVPPSLCKRFDKPVVAI